MAQDAITCVDLLETISKHAKDGLDRAKLMGKLRMTFRGLKDLAPSSEERVAREFIGGIDVRRHVCGSGYSIDKADLQAKLCINSHIPREFQAFKKHDPCDRRGVLGTYVSGNEAFAWAEQVLHELGGWDGLTERRQRLPKRRQRLAARHEKAALIATKARLKREILGFQWLAEDKKARRAIVLAASEPLAGWRNAHHAEWLANEARWHLVDKKKRERELEELERVQPKKRAREVRIRVPLARVPDTSDDEE